jgi:tetratricopeptide (TPR) repeat protein
MLVFRCKGYSAQNPVEQTIESYIEQAQRAQSSGNIELAIQRYRQVLSIRHNFPEVETNLGLLLYHDGDYTNAAEHLQSALRQKSDSLPAKLFLGMALVKLGKPDLAVRPLRAALEQEPKNADARLALCKAYSASNKGESAVEECWTAARLSPQNPETWYHLGNAALKAAKTLVDNWYSKSSDSPRVYILKAEAYRERESYAEAIVEYGKALRLSREAPNGTYLALGEVFLLQGDIEDAKQQFALIPEGSETFQRAWGMAQLTLAQRDYNGFSTLLEEIRRVNPEFVRDPAWFVVPALTPAARSAVWEDLQSGRAGKELGTTGQEFLKIILMRSTEDSIGLEEKVPQESTLVPEKTSVAAERRNPGHLWRDWHFKQCVACLGGLTKNPGTEPRVLAELAACEWAMGHFEKSWRTSSKAIQADPLQDEARYWNIKSLLQISKSAFLQLSRLPAGSSRTHELIGKAYEARGQDNKAAEEYRVAAQTEPGNVNAYLLLGELHLRSMRYEQAVQSFKEALEHSPSDPDAHYGLGIGYFELRQPDGAIEHLQKALQVLPNSPDAHTALGQAYRQVGRYHDAIAEFESALPSDQDGLLHYQLFQMYQRVGEKFKADLALKQSTELREKSRKSREKVVQQQLRLTQDP